MDKITKEEAEKARDILKIYLEEKLEEEGYIDNERIFRRKERRQLMLALDNDYCLD